MFTPSMPTPNSLPPPLVPLVAKLAGVRVEVEAAVGALEEFQELRLVGRISDGRAGFTVLAGGGMRTGQAIGSTNRYGEHPQLRPVKFQEVFATLYHNLGIDVSKVTVPDFSGRPQFLVPDAAVPIRELVG